MAEGKRKNPVTKLWLQNSLNEQQIRQTPGEIPKSLKFLGSVKISEYEKVEFWSLL
jgi:hypothetical protein